jgi:hypothetical protein
MGRPSQSVDYDLIVNGGKNVWTDGDPVKQPHLMGVLAANIRNSKHPKLADKKEAWAKRIEAKAAAQAQAAAPTETAHAQATGLTMQRRTLADATQVGLTRLKRDLKNLGMTEAQVHEIIPEAPTGSGSTPPPPKPKGSAPARPRPQVAGRAFAVWGETPRESGETARKTVRLAHSNTKCAFPAIDGHVDGSSSARKGTSVS